MFRYLFIFTLLSLNGCSQDQSDPVALGNESRIAEDAHIATIDGETAHKAQQYDYQRLYQLIVSGQASFAEVKQALTDTDIVRLTNVMHGLYSMRWHRGVYHLYTSLWNLERESFPKFSWDELEKIPVRIALASTINRVKVFDTQELQEFIRLHRYDPHEFHRAQVVIALGLNADPDDIDYVAEMADSDNHYVVQSAISGLSLFAHPKARDAMIDLFYQYQDTEIERAKLIAELLKKIYRWQPPSDLG